MWQGWQLRGKPNGSSRAECRALRAAARLVCALQWLHRHWCNDVTPAGAALGDVYVLRVECHLRLWPLSLGRAACERRSAVAVCSPLMRGAQENV